MLVIPDHFLVCKVGGNARLVMEMVRLLVALLLASSPFVLCSRDCGYRLPRGISLVALLVLFSFFFVDGKFLLCAKQMKMVTVHSNTSLSVYTRLAQVVYFIGRLNFFFYKSVCFLQPY